MDKMNAFSKSTHKFQPEQLVFIANQIKERYGLDYTGDKLKDLERKIQSLLQNTAQSDVYFHYLVSGNFNCIPNFINELTIPETYFLRNRNLFEALQHVILPELIKRKKYTHQINIWSAGCSSGEEPYSVAILLTELLGANHHWQIKIIATDVNPEILKKAKKAVYTEWSFRGTPSWLKEKYFSEVLPGKFQLKAEVRQMVTFKMHNLVDGPYPPVSGVQRFDLIFCRNVLIYMPKATVIEILTKFYAILDDDGYLITGPSEFPSLKLKKYKPKTVRGTILYQKAKPEPSNPISETRLKKNIDSPRKAGKKVRLLSAKDVIPQRNESAPVESPKSSEIQNKHDNLLNDELTQIRRLADKGLLGEARKLCEEYVEKYPFAKRGYFYLGNIYLEMGDLAKAEENFKRALYFDPNYAMAHFNLGTIYLMQGKSEQAQKTFKNVLGILQKMEPSASVPDSDGLVVSQLASMAQTIIAGQ